MRKLNELFEKITDKVSYGTGTPANIIFWIVAVSLWIGFGPVIAKSNFLPAWFTSNAFNFPLNTVTTLAELYIGFLVAAAANRTEKANKKLAKDNYELTDKIEHLMEQQDDMLELMQKEQEEELEELKKINEGLQKDNEILTKQNEQLRETHAQYEIIKKKGEEIINNYG